MTRSINATTATELQQDSFVQANLIHFGSPLTLTFTDAAFPITWSIFTFQSNGHLLDVSSVKETNDLRINSMKLTLSAVDQAFVSAFLSQDYMDAPISYWTALLDGATVIGDPISKFDGNITGFDIDESGSSSKITVECASHWANFDTKNGHKTNDASQQSQFPGDLGMEFASASQRSILWGRN